MGRRFVTAYVSVLFVRRGSVLQTTEDDLLGNREGQDRLRLEQRDRRLVCRLTPGYQDKENTSLCSNRCFYVGATHDDLPVTNSLLIFALVAPRRG